MQVSSNITNTTLDSLHFMEHIGPSNILNYLLKLRGTTIIDI